MRTNLIAVLAVACSLGQIQAAEPADVTVHVTKSHIDFLAGKELIGRYHIAPSVAKPYIWPLNAPGGIPMTRAWPMKKGLPGESTDHVHQKSVWFCHGDVIPEGLKIQGKIRNVKGVDFWSEHKNAGKIVCIDPGKPKTDKNHGQTTTKNQWQTSDGTKILDETRTIHVFDLGDSRLLVFDIDLHASVAPITFGDTKEGSFGIRINDTIRERSGGKLENAGGKVGEKSMWGRTSPWVDYSGKLDGKVMGMAVFDHPKNPSPACWHARGYGLLAANPFGRKSFPGARDKPDLVKIPKGGHLKFRYGIFLHPGDAKGGKVAEHYKAYLKLGS